MTEMIKPGTVVRPQDVVSGGVYAVTQTFNFEIVATADALQDPLIVGHTQVIDTNGITRSFADGDGSMVFTFVKMSEPASQ